MSDLENEAIREKADELDMDLEKDADYLYIAREFLNASLPKNWREDTYEDPEDGVVYPYYVDPTGESHWDHPLLDEYKKKFQDEKARQGKKKKEKKSSTNPKKMKEARGERDDCDDRDDLDDSRDNKDDCSDVKKERVQKEDKIEELDMEEVRRLEAIE